MKNKKILFVLSSEKFFGGEKVAVDIAKNLKNEFEFIFFLPNTPSKELEEKIKDFQIYYPIKNSFLEIIKTLKKIIIFLKPNVVHAHGVRASIFLKFIFLFFLKRKKFKFIYTLHGIHFIRRMFPVNFIFLFWEIFTNNFFLDYLVCVGKDDYNLAKKLKFIKNDKIFLIENGIDILEYQNIKENFLRKNFNLKNEIIITTICRLHYQKDVKTLIKAVNLLKNENLILFIVGDGPDKNKLEKLVKKLDIKEKIKFLGFKKEIKEILKDTDIFILSTRWEGLPLVILESWAIKKPVIASNVNGIKGLINNNENGILFEFNNYYDLKEKILFLIKNKDLKNKIANNGFKLIKEKYNILKMTNKYKKIYQYE